MLPFYKKIMRYNHLGPKSNLGIDKNFVFPLALIKLQFYQIASF